MTRDHAELLLALAQSLASSSGAARWPALCRAAVTGLDADDGSIVLSVAGTPELLCATSVPAQRLGEAQVVAGEGPVHDVLRLRRPVLTPDLGGAVERWPRLSAFYDTVLVGPVCALPMLADPSEVVGVLTVHHDLGGPLGRSLHSPASTDRIRTMSDLQFVANTIGAVVLADLQSPETSERRWSERDRVSQATGMVVAQVGIGPDDALDLIRARAFVEGVTVVEVSERLVAGELDLGPRGGTDAAPGGAA